VSRAIYVDCFSGASGDMLLGALVDAGVDLEALRTGLSGLPVGGWRLEAERVERHGLGGTRVHVELTGDHQPHRGLGEVLRIISRAGLPAGVVDRASEVFSRLAEAEAAIHGTTTEEVEFHEVGAIDAIVDVVGVVLGFVALEVDWSQLTCSGLPLGSGWTNSAHGRLPIPAPASLELVRRAGAPLRPPPREGEVGELTTPTGAALLSTLATFVGAPPAMTIERIGYGFGTRQPPWPNAVRLLVGASVTVAPESARGLKRDQVVEIQTNLDDATPEELGFAMERLLEAGALDVAFGPLQMKKNRPGVLVRVLARPTEAEHLTAVLLEHTSAFGARLQTLERLIVERGEQTVATPWGEVRVKLKLLGRQTLRAPEFEDCARAARAAGVTLRQVYDAARNAAMVADVDLRGSG
jgi:uncharacterized protein (TIGR00299 family) protein